MPQVQISVQLEEAHLEALEEEAGRRGVSVQSLLEATVNALLRDLERRAADDSECPCIPC